MMNTAKKLTLEEIKEMPRGSVIWTVLYDCSNDGVVWHEIDPAMIIIPGEGGFILGGDRDSTFEFDINDQLADNSLVEFWSSEPTDNLLRGITRDEYNALPDPNDDSIKFPDLAAKITCQGLTFEKFSNQLEMDSEEFWKALTGEREFEQWEIVKIRTALNLTDDQTITIFFPGFMANNSASCADLLKMCNSIGKTVDEYYYDHR